MRVKNPGEALQFLEVSSQNMALAGDLSARIAKSGGAALIMDYGRNAPYAASLQVGFPLSAHMPLMLCKRSATQGCLLAYKSGHPEPRFCGHAVRARPG